MLNMDVCPKCGRAVMAAMVRVYKPDKTYEDMTMLERHIRECGKEKKGPRWL